MLIMLATFVALTTVVLFLGRAMTAESPVAQRVRQLAGEAPGRTPRGERAGLLCQLVASVGSYGFGGDRSLSHRLTVAGYRGANATALFLGVRTLIRVGPALLTLVPAVSSGKPLGRALMTAALVGVWGHLLANLWLKRRARARVHKITKGLPDALDLMVVCLEAGLGLNATISKVGEERSTIQDVVGDEFGQVAVEMRNGRTRGEALRALGTRNGSDDLKALVGLVVQSDRLGASMSKTLRTHADLLRTRRRQRAEEAARKLPIKVLFPLALFILPALFVVTTGPAVLKIGQLSALMGKR
jgi:tight adherence protein C